MSLIEKIQELVESEVQRRLMKYAQVISKKHDISLKLLLQDLGTDNVGTEETKTGQCLGITARKTQCKTSGKNGGYCARHLTQKKEPPKKVPEVVPSEENKNKHVGHTMKECMFLAGCPACEKTRGPSQNLLIDF
jgi:hypothetical protein